MLIVTPFGHEAAWPASAAAPATDPPGEEDPNAANGYTTQSVQALDANPVA